MPWMRTMQLRLRVYISSLFLVLVKVESLSGEDASGKRHQSPWHGSEIFKLRTTSENYDEDKDYRRDRILMRSHVPVIMASRSTSIWPPWPFSRLRKKANGKSVQASQSTNYEEDDGDAEGMSYRYPSMAALVFSYLRHRTRILVRQLGEIGSQVWFNLPPAVPPLLLLASVPQKNWLKDPITGSQIARTTFPIISNPLARLVVTLGLGMAILSWSQQELNRKRKLTPLPLAIHYESVSKVLLPPFLPENVPEPDRDSLENFVASNHAPEERLSGEEEGNGMLSKVSPNIRRQKNVRNYVEEWKRGRQERKRELARIRRLRIFDELVALQALKRKAASRKARANETSACANDTGFALVTGASEGIGRAIAVELARWEIPLVLIARNIDKLTSLAYDLQACYGVKCCVLAADLSEIDAAERIHEVTTKAGIAVDILVNNAGIAAEGSAVEMATSDVERMVIVNAVTYAKLSQLYGLDMKRRGRGRMLMVSSMAGLCNAAPNTAVYGATKAFGKSLSLSLAKELEPYGVGVTCLLPGPVRGTQFKARSGTHRALCWSMPFYSRTPKTVAHLGVISLLDGDSQTIPGWQNRVFATIIRPLIPQRFEIMTVQAAFSPFRLPSIRKIFQQPPKVQSDRRVSWSSSELSPLEDGEISIAPSFFDSSFRTQPLPCVLTLPEQHKKSDFAPQCDDVEDTNSGTEVNETADDRSIHSSQREKRSEPETTADFYVDSPDQDLENGNVDRAMATKQNESESEASEEAFSTSDDEKQKVFATVDVDEADVSVRAEKEISTQESTKTQNDNNNIVNHEVPIMKKTETTNGNRVGGPDSVQWDDDEDSAFSPRLGPIDLLNHRKLGFLKETVDLRQKSAAIIEV